MTAQTAILINDVGLTEVFRPPEPLVDIVFVHGLNGHPYKTWATHNPEVFWPKDLLPRDVDQEQCRILTYGYDANVSVFMGGASRDHVHDHAETLAARLAANRSRARALERPLIFVVHSLGGLVVKRMLIYCSDAIHPNQERLKSVFVSTYGILFLGTPHNGSDLAKWGSILQSISAMALPKKIFDSQSQLLKALETNNSTLQVINREFTQLSNNFRIYFFHEAKPMDLKGTRQFVVDEDSAAPNLQGVERAGIEKDHSSMCKFEDQNSPGYDLISEGIQRYAKEAPNKIHARWQAEKRTQQFQKQDIVREILSDDIPGVLMPTTNLPPHQASHGKSMGAQSIPKLLKETPPEHYEIEEYEDTMPDRHKGSSLAPTASLVTASPKSCNGPLLIAPLGFRPNYIFKGFQMELEWMDRKLNSERKAQLGTVSVLLWGPPGCGKSHLARQYVYLHRNKHPTGTFWVDCKSKESMMQDYWEIGQQMGCFSRCQQDILPSNPSFIKIVREALQEQHGWIFVFDGIFFPNEIEITAFQQFLSDSQGNKIIYTSVDKTLAKRNRLLVPSGLRVPPLDRHAACEFLFESLSIRKISPIQHRKAKELVQHFRCLPLGIHAAAHALIARGRPLERYVPGSLSNDRLAQPFLEIIDKLTEDSHEEALRLLILLSFIYHRVPVALLQFGARFFAEQGLNIESNVLSASTNRHIDNTVAVLIRCGLVERQLQSLSASSSDWDASSQGTLRRPAAKTNLCSSNALPNVPIMPQDSSGLDLMVFHEDMTDIDSIDTTSVGIDTIRIHTVVQTVVLDKLRQDNDQYRKWLVLACTFLQASFGRAKARNKSYGGQLSVTDFHEYRTHGYALLNHFPRPSASLISQSLSDARCDLQSLLKTIDREIQNQSLAETLDKEHNRSYRSVFERSASSSEDGPDTPTQDLTGSMISDRTLPEGKTVSPTNMCNHARLSTHIDLEMDDGYLTDDERDSIEESADARMSVYPRPGRIQAPRPLAISSAGEIGLRGRALVQKRDLREFQNVPITGQVENRNVVSERLQSPSRSAWWQNPFRRRSSVSQAAQALAALRAKDLPSVDRPLLQMSVSTNNILSNMSRPTNLRAPLEEKPPNKRLIPRNPKLPQSRPFVFEPQHLTRLQSRESPASAEVSPSLPVRHATATKQCEMTERNFVSHQGLAGIQSRRAKVLEHYTPVASLSGEHSSSTIMSDDPSTESYSLAQSLPTMLESTTKSSMQGTFEDSIYYHPDYLQSDQL